MKEKTWSWVKDKCIIVTQIRDCWLSITCTQLNSYMNQVIESIERCMKTKIWLWDKNWESPQVSLISGVGKTEGEGNMSNNLDSDLIKDSANKTEIFVYMLKACAKEKDLHRGNKIHSDIVWGPPSDSKNNLQLQFKKCKQGAITLWFLSFMISEQGIQLDPVKRRVVVQYLKPSNIKSL